MDVRIYRPAKSAMQSGKRRTKEWVIDFLSQEPKYIEPLMGWTGMRDCRPQIKLRFHTQEEAIAWANSQNLIYEIIKPQFSSYKPKSYGDNFLATHLR